MTLRIFYLLTVFIFCSLSAQKKLAFDTLKLKDADDLHADDYGNVYIYKNKDFSFTKYDSLGKQLGKMMLTVPYKVQSVQNPLSVPLFSENAQEMKFVDQNLNEIQRVDFRQKFGFIKMAYAEDLQQLWLLDESSKRLIQYNFRNDTTINSYPFDASFDELMDLLVYENKIYILTKKNITVYNLKFEKIFEAATENAKRFRRENDSILVITTQSILKYIPEKELATVFSDPGAQIVDKNILSFFEIKANNLYLYTLEKPLQAQEQKEPEPVKINPEQQPVQPVEETPAKAVEKKEPEQQSADPLRKLMDESAEVQAAGF
ncbi:MULTISPECIES: hypothetical protein [Chryseobacterium]|uniref:Uncharacterized protein n=1 Tax=Chryseobacterium camelliae TaxID=1265445 RepID=A0ABU0THR4_9FLAO|nr:MULTISPECIES: hypothetical protein [Chryseobacterium]MDQ1096595.1 hypothetical protein [Chryseobacterium camelliae]MDR6087877.1 hypothetical protein [Chryseobacterium sp. SORGH_AS_0909]MDR6132252.1 hypothetical protein [Chryseobacterium sp. SORGH_AS_1175]MDT3409543.1 hypothetical protein [Pseudacidovorax intermedius]